MKSISILGAALLGASFVLSSPVQEEQRAALTLLTPDFKGAEIAKPSSCSSGFTLTLTVPVNSPTPDPSFDFFTFCSAFLQPTATVTKTTTFLSTATATAATTTAYAETTQTIASTGTTTALCPVPSSVSPVCGSSAWGLASNNIFYKQPLDPYDCHQLCLANPACNSFQVQNSSYPNPQCNLYNATAGANDTIVGSTSPFLFYDWDCPQYLPAGCSKKPTTSTTIVTVTVSGGSVPLPTAPARLHDARGANAAASATLPGFLAPFGSSSITNVCNCIIESPSPTALVIKTTGVASVVSATVTATSVVVFTVTERPHYSTIVSSVT